LLTGTWQNTQPHEHLKAVADSEHGHTSLDSTLQRVVQRILQLERKQPTRTERIGVTEPAGDYHCGAIAQRLSCIANLPHVNLLGAKPGKLQGKRNVSISVGARCSEDRGKWCGHCGAP
jgi:hypothetical protein